MKKRIFIIAAVILLLAMASVAWEILGPSTTFTNARTYLFIRTGMRYEEVVQTLERDSVIHSHYFFNLLARKVDYPANVKAGKYEIRRGMNLIALLRMLRNGRQVPVNLVITKLRTREDLAGLVGRKLEPDSASFLSFLNNGDSLKPFGLDTNTVMTAVLPDTYTHFWNTTPSRIFKKFYTNYRNFWTPERIQQARDRGLTPTTAYILASIVEEETNRAEDKGKIASVYLNRLRTGMKLAADPTVKFALRDFEIKRIYEKHLAVESPFNTYKFPGLPPGPICTPSLETLEAVLSSPQTNYLYFVAKPDFSGFSNFSENFSQHMQFAKAYQKALDEQMKIGQTLRNVPVK